MVMSLILVGPPIVEDAIGVFALVDANEAEAIAVCSFASAGQPAPTSSFAASTRRCGGASRS